MDKNYSKKSIFLGALFLLVVIAGGLSAWYFLWPKQPLYPREVMLHAEELQERIISFDSHISVPLDFNTEETEANRDGPYQFDLVKAASGRLSGAALTVFSWPDMETGPNAPHRPSSGMLIEARQQQEVRYKIITSIVRDYPNQAGIAYTPEDFTRLYNENKFAIIISMVNAYALGDDISQLDKWAARGMRIFGYSYVGNNSWADSSRPLGFFNDIPDDLDGLSKIGKQAVQRLNDLGVIIDVSQMSNKALSDVIQLTRSPLIAARSAVRGIVNVAPNLSDKELQLIKNTGGMVHIVGYSRNLRPLSQSTTDKINILRARFDLPPFTDPIRALAPASEPVTAIWSEERFGEYMYSQYDILGEEPKASISDYVNAIDYAVAKIGIDHVGISSDFNDGGGVNGWMDVGDTRNLTAELIQHGYSDADITKLWGSNFLRVWRDVQALALKPGSSP